MKNLEELKKQLQGPPHYHFITQHDADLLLDAIRLANIERDEARAEIERLRREVQEAMELRAHDMARQSAVIAFLRKRRGQLVIERDEARAEIERYLANHEEAAP